MFFRIAALTAFSLLLGNVTYAQTCGTTNCRAQGHNTLINDGTGLPWAYTEDIKALCPDANCATISYDSSLPWSKIWAGCTELGEDNVQSTTTFNLLMRAGLTVNRTTSSPSGGYEMQLRLKRPDGGELITAWEHRNIGSDFPRFDPIGSVIADLTAGNYEYSLWARLLNPGSITFDLLWITAQGASDIYDAARFPYGDRIFNVPTVWTAIGEAITINNPVQVDLMLQASYKIVNGTLRDRVWIGFSLDGASSGQQNSYISIPAIPQGVNVFDHKLSVPAGSHTLQIWMKTEIGPFGGSGNTSINFVMLEHFATPETLSSPHPVPAGKQFLLTDTVFAGNPAPTDHVPANIIMNPTQTCDATQVSNGPWTYLGEFTVPPTPETVGYSWIYDGWVEVLAAESGIHRAEIGIDNIKWKQVPSTTKVCPNDANVEAAADHGVAGVQVSDATSNGFYFYGDAGKWGNRDGGNTVKLFMRLVGGGTFTVGKRYLAVKALPAQGCIAN